MSHVTKISRLILLKIFMFSTGLYAHEPIKLVIPNFKPYTYSLNGNVAGLGVDAVVHILEKMNKPYAIDFVPNYGRALAEVKMQRADGFFMASENEERNTAAVFSHPILINRWSWFVLNNSSEDLTKALSPKVKIGTIMNTNTHRWLLDNNYNVFFHTQDPKKLVSNLFNKRVEALFLAEDVFKEAIQNFDEVPEIRSQVVFEKPFGVYFSKAFLAKNKTFLSKFNALAKISFHSQD